MYSGMDYPFNLSPSDKYSGGHKIDHHGYTYLPIIVETVAQGYPQVAHITDPGFEIVQGDILVTDSKNSKHGSWNLHVQEVAYIEDLFEDYIEVQLQAVTANASLWHIKDFIKVGDELKLLMHARPEK